jgi:hypothetical protein
MLIYLQEQGHTVNRNHVPRLKRVLGLAGKARGPATSNPHAEHNIHPYLLRGVTITLVATDDFRCAEPRRKNIHLTPTGRVVQSTGIRTFSQLLKPTGFQPVVV